MSLLAAIDVGGTKTLIELFDAGSGRTQGAAEFPTPRSGDPILVLASAIEKLSCDQTLAAIAVGCPGPLDPSAGLVVDPPNLARSWWHLPLGRGLSETFGCTVALENDGNLGALGESVAGAGRGFPSVLYLTVSTGVGAGFVTGETIFRGGRGFGLEVGHTTINASASAVCACGRVGCLEAWASGSAIAGRARAAGLGDGSGVSARSVAAAAASGEPRALRILSEAAAYLGQGIVNLMYVFDPTLVLIGGGVAQSDLFVDLVTQAIASEKVMDPFRDVPVRQAELGRASVISGAKVLVRRAAQGA
ncbi:MAG: ROK family protein [Actinomycetota bacterium]